MPRIIQPLVLLVLVGALHAAAVLAGDNQSLESRVARLEERVAALEAGRVAVPAVPPGAGSKAPSTAQRAGLVAMSRAITDVLLGKSEEVLPEKRLSPEQFASFSEVADDVDAGAYGFAWPREATAKVPGLHSACTMICVDLRMAWMKGVMKATTPRGKEILRACSTFTDALEKGDMKAAHDAWLGWRKALPEGWWK